MLRRLVIRWFRRICFCTLIFVVLALLSSAILFRKALYNRFFLFPRVEQAWQDLRELREDVSLEDGWQEFRGICHTHSHLSHDSTVPFETILEAAHTAHLQFVLLTDHCEKGMGDFSRQWSGIHEGVLFVPGFETGNGLLVWGLPTNSTLDCNQPVEDLAREIDAKGGTCVFSHTETDRPYELQEVSGMEVYNIHTDILDESFVEMLGDTLFSSRRFPDVAVYSIFDPQTAIWRQWDEVNESRPFAGISANDAHQNVGITLGRNGDALHLNSTSGDPLLQIPLGPLAKLFHAGSELFRLDLDPYERSLRFVNMHVLAEELTTDAVLRAVREGRSYIGFDIIADSGGFVFMATDGQTRAAMGEAIQWSLELRFVAASPLPCRFRMMEGGIPVVEQEGRSFEYPVEGPGVYRLEAELQIFGEWVSWVITNPIRVLSRPS